MKRFQCLEMMDFLKDWTSWRNSLKEGIGMAKKMGMSDEEIQSWATKVGDLLVEKVCPATKEEELLKEMWEIATPSERKVIATLIFKMVK
jgi:hypothetical protein